MVVVAVVGVVVVAVVVAIIKINRIKARKREVVKYWKINTNKGITKETKIIKITERTSQRERKREIMEIENKWSFCAILTWANINAYVWENILTYIHMCP